MIGFAIFITMPIWLPLWILILRFTTLREWYDYDGYKEVNSDRNDKA